jgi:GntR family transcriptional regulator / MocR family aminotransferase
VGEVDDVGGYLDGDADRDAEVPGVDVQVNHGDREIVGNGPAERGLHHPAQVGVTEHIPGLNGDVTPELDGVTFDKIAGTGHVRPRGLAALQLSHVQAGQSGDGYPADLLVDVVAGNVRGLRERLESALRAAVQDGRLVPGATLPPSRTLAAELAISRSVVVEAYANLKADGYLETRRGGGTRVRAEPDPDQPARCAALDGARDVNQNRHRYEPPRRPRPAEGSPRIQLFGGLPDPALFPRAKWLQHYRAALAQLPDRELTYPDMFGAPSLRAALAAYLGRVRGVATAAERLLICSGFTQGLTLTCRALRRRGARRVAMEDPCFGHHRQAVALTGLEPVPVPVDSLGLDPARIPADVHAVLVAPAHSYPTGYTLGADRRHALIAWARRAGAMVIEDDYDAEFRYDRQPIGAIQGLAATSPVTCAGCGRSTAAGAMRRSKCWPGTCPTRGGEERPPDSTCT